MQIRTNEKQGFNFSVDLQTLKQIITMEYKGKLYGKVGKTFIPLMATTDEYEGLEKNNQLLRAKLKVAEKALNEIIIWQENIDEDWDYPETIASRAVELLAKIDGF